MTETTRAVRASTHSDKSWTPYSGYAFAAKIMAAPISADELSYASTEFPLAFLKAERTMFVALLGVNTDQNLFVAPDGRWVGQYVPAVMRGYPFKLLPAEEGRYALGYDDASGLIGAAGQGEPFFDDKGEPTERIQQVLQFLIRLQNGLDQGTRVAAKLEELDLLETWPLKAMDGGKERNVVGLQRVNETKLSALADDQFLELRKIGALPLIYAQLLSMANIPTLGRLGQAHAQYAAMNQKQEQEVASMFEPIAADEEIDWDALLRDDKA